ncbi:MAG: serine hydrolase [Candidatus Falkowbacteria bacterium]
MIKLATKKITLVANIKVISVILILSLFGNIGLLLYGSKEEQAHGRVADYTMLSQVRNYIKQKDLIVNVQPLRDQFNEMGKDKRISIYFEFLNTGANIAVNKDAEFYPASLMKIPIAMAVMKKIERGQWSIENELVLLPEDKDPRFGNLYKQSANTKISIEDLLEEMLVNSDNTARAIFMRNLALSDIGEVLLHLGLDDIFNVNQQVGAKKFSVFWRSLFYSTYLNPESSEKLIDIMLHSAATDFLANGLPEGTPFSHKIGVVNDINTYSDSGIVYFPNRPYILTVVTQNMTQLETKNVMKNIGEKAYNYVAKY